MRRQRAKRHSKALLSNINVVPYIDVMLVLLIIFMITAPLLKQGVQVDLPKAHAKALAKQPQEPIIVSVDKNGAFFLNITDHPDHPMTAEELLTRMAAEITLAKRQGRTETVLVKGDEGVNYGRVVAAMVLLQRAGVDKVGLMTQEPAESRMNA